MVRTEGGKAVASIVCNGEIYNMKSLRRQLEGEGVFFETDSDTEVVWRVMYTMEVRFTFSKTEWYLCLCPMG